MADADPIEVLVYGLGAIGSFYAFILQRCDRVRLTVVARSNYDAVKQNGIFLDSSNHGQNRFYPSRVIRSPAEAPPDITFDYVVCAHKAIDPDADVISLDPVINETKTTIVILQNGVGNEDPFRKRYPVVTIISCVVWVGAIQSSPGVTQHKVAENTQLGLFPSSADRQQTDQRCLTDFTALLAQGGTPFEVLPDIQIARWEKVVWNAAWNAITALTMQDTMTWLESSADAIPWTQRVMREVIAVGRACGVPLADGLEEEFIRRMQGLKGVRTSMQTDREMGRPMEIEVILGVPVRKGRELGVSIPSLETLYVLLRAVNEVFLRGRSS